MKNEPISNLKVAMLMSLLGVSQAAGELVPTTTYTGNTALANAFVGALIDPLSWNNGLPSNANPGLVAKTLNTWTGPFWTDVAIRQTGGTIYSDLESFAMRGGGSGSGAKTILEIEDTGNSDFSYANLELSGILTMWSQFGEGQELNLLAGHVSIGSLNAASSSPDLSTINLRDGRLDIASITGGRVTVNLLAGGAGEIVVANQNGPGLNQMKLNFESGFKGSFALMSNSAKPTGSAGGYWEFIIGRGQVFIDGEVTIDTTPFLITTIEEKGTLISLPEFGKWAVWALEDAEGDVDTGSWMGRINVQGGDWIWNYSLSRYFFLPTGFVSSFGGWTYIPLASTVDPVPQGAEFWSLWELADAAGNVNTGSWLEWLNVSQGDWIWSYSLNRYLYIPQGLVGRSGGWAFIVF